MTHELHRWTDRDGQDWACMAYDHGPMCRLCQKVDNVLAACLDNVEDGHMIATIDANGEFLFKMTDQGMKAAAIVIDWATAPDHSDGCPSQENG